MHRRISTNDLCQKFLQDKQTNGCKQSTIALYNRHIQKYILPNLPSRVSKIRDKQLVELADTLRETLDRNTIKDISILLNSVLKYAKEEKYTRICLKMKSPPKRRKKIDVFSDEEQVRLEGYLFDNPSWFHFGILLCLYSGIRVGELSALQMTDIEGETITIDKTLQRIPTSGKGKKTIVVIDEPKSHNSIRRIPTHERIKMYRELLPTIPDTSYFLTGNERYIEPRGVERKFDKILDSCHIKHRKFHTLRHTFATNCVRSGIDMNVLSEIMGHSNVKTTMDYYIHVDMAFKELNMKKYQLSQS